MAAEDAKRDRVYDIFLAALLRNKMMLDLAASKKETCSVEGARVIRGPDWKWGNQDGDEGSVGTVIGASSGTANVKWDKGGGNNYRCGHDNAFDLLLFDSASAGVKHPTATCDACKKFPVEGIRWKCTICYDYDLCNNCYMSDMHDTTHPFDRIDEHARAGVRVPARRGCKRVQLNGIFLGAKVTRGPDWIWMEQDGGQDQVGTVKGFEKNWVKVKWPNEIENNYRLGKNGKVDVKCIQAAAGCQAYVTHLNYFGKNESLVVGSDFHVGQKVKICVSMNELKSMQEGHGGFNDKMVEYINVEGTVQEITARGDIDLQFAGKRKWRVNPAALSPSSDSAQNVRKIVKPFQGEQKTIAPKLLLKMSDVTKISQIGEGAFGEVFLAKVNHDGSKVVYKEIKVKVGLWEETKKEVDLLQKLKHNNVVHYRGCDTISNKLVIFMDFCDMGDLASFIEKYQEKKSKIKEGVIANFLEQICKALVYIHGEKIIHRDMKPQNVFLALENGQPVLKIGDFGLAKVVQESIAVGTVCGTLAFMAPEVLTQVYDSKADIYSLGCIVHMMATFSPPFLIPLMRKMIEPITDEYSVNFHSLVTAMIEMNPKDRPDASDILKCIS